MKSILEALWDTEKTYKHQMIKLTKAAGITIAEWHLLQHLVAGFDTQDKLASEMGLDNSTLSRQLKALAKKELVSMVAVGYDRRQLIYELTPAGQAALQKVDQAHQEFSELAFQVWSPEEKSMMQILLNRLDKSLRRSLD